MPAQRPFDLIVVGELNADLILRGDVEPAFGQVEKLVDDAALVLGSSSAIFACGAARLGIKTAFISKIGDDTFGRFVLAQLNERGVDTSGVVVDGNQKTGLSVILNRGIDRAILTHAGTIADFNLDDIDTSRLALARHVHVGGFYLLNRLRPQVPSLFALAKQNGLTTSLDTNYDPEERWEGLADTLKFTDIFLPNETELMSITAKQDVNEALIEMGRRVPLVAAKMGAQGGRAICAGAVCAAPAMQMNVVDTVGAGDSFDSGFIAGQLLGWSLERSLKLACVCGSLSTRASGGTAAQATLDEVQQCLGEERE